MNGDVKVRDVMRREYVAASEGDSLAETAALMLEEAVEAVVVLRGSEPVGMVTERDVLRKAIDGGSLSELTVSDAMREDPPTIAPDQSLGAATELISGTDIRRMLVLDGAEPIGVVSEHDVVTASTLSPGMNGAAGAEGEAEPMMTEATATGETAAADEYSSQGICEVCGSLTRDLSTFNGQLVCNDCKDV